MAAPRFLQNIGGFITMTVAVIVGGGGSANQIPALNASGQLDITMMPPGISADVVTCPASEALAAGALVNFWLNAGVVNARNADNTNTSKPAHGYTIASVSSSGTAIVYSLGQQNTGVTGLTIGSTYFLGTVGAVTTTPPSTAGSLSQEVGIATSANNLSTYMKNTIAIN